MRRRPQSQGLHERDAERKARFRIFWQSLPRRRVDQRIQIRKSPERFGGHGMREAAVSAFKPARRGGKRRLKRVSAAQNSIKQAQCSPTCRRTLGIGRSTERDRAGLGGSSHRSHVAV